MLPWSVIPIAGCPSATALATISSRRAAPSSIENSVWTWRWVNESVTGGQRYERRGAQTTPVLFRPYQRAVAPRSASAAGSQVRAGALLLRGHLAGAHLRRHRAWRQLA